MMERRILWGLVAGIVLGPIFLDPFSAAMALTSPVAKAGMVAFQLGCLGIGIAVLPGRALSIAASLLVLPSLGEWLHLVRMGSYTTVGFWTSVWATNPAEIREIVSAFWPWLAGGTLFTAVCLLRLPRLRLTRRVRFSILAVSLVPFAVVGSRDVRVLKRLEVANADLPLPWVELQVDHLNRSHPLGIPLRAVRAWCRNDELHGVYGNLRGFRYGLEASAPVRPSIGVLILGEASRASSWAVAGGDSGTTPRLSRRRDLIVFRDVMAPANATNIALPLLLTRATPEHLEAATRETGLVGMAREAGFQTWWISNQPLGSGGFGLIYVWTALADSTWLSSKGESMQGESDDILLAPIARALKSPAPRLFLVVHLMGSHWRYSERYRPSDEVFRPAYKGISFPRVAETLAVRNSYRNSIRVTDRVVDSVIRMVAASGRKGWVAYVSDHGENLMDDDRQAILHVRPEPTLQEVKVPLLFWATRGTVPAERWNLAASRSGDPIDARSVLPSLALLAGWRLPGLDTALSPFSGGWQVRERRVLSSSDRIYSEKELR